MTAVRATWGATAQLRWFAGGRQVGEDRYSFGVDCPELPEDDRLRPINVHRLVTLQLMCAMAERQYGVPPRVVQIWLDKDDIAVIPMMDRARWRMGQGFCHGTGIRGVADPPSRARLMGVQKVQVEK